MRRLRVLLCALPVKGTRRQSFRSLRPLLDPLESRELLAAGPFGTNVEIGNFESLVNWLQFPGRWLNAPGQSFPITYNASGDPRSDASLLYDYRVNQPWDGPDPNAVGPNLSGTYHLSFNGKATIQPMSPGSSTPFTVQNQTYDAATNTTRVDITVPAGNTNEFFGISFVNTQATAASAVGTGFSNARLIRPGYAADSTQLYTNEFLAALKPYSVLRYLASDGANAQPFFDGNTLVTVDAPQVDQTGMPWEYLIALANQTKTDMWINVPQGATDAYITALAGIFKNGGTVGGVTYPGLDPSLKIYLEYSNEVWGGIAQNAYYQSAAVQDTADNHPLSTFPGNVHVYDNPDGVTGDSVNVAAARRYVERTAQIGQIFQNVLGADPTHQRLRPVLGWQENFPGVWIGLFDWYEHFFGSAAQAFYGLGNATYWNATDGSSVNSILSTLQQQETAYAIPNAIQQTAIATFYGMKNVAYEGGPNIGGDGNTQVGQNALAASRDPRMEQIVYQHYLNFYADGGDTAAYYTGVYGIWTPQNEWQAAEDGQYGNPTASPKYRGTADVAAAAPVAVTAGVHVAPGSTSFDATVDFLGQIFNQPDAGQRGYWLLNVAASGTYHLTMSTGPINIGAPGQIVVWLNDKPLSNPINVTASSTIDLGNLKLPAGLSTMSIQVIHGRFDPSQTDPTFYKFQPLTFTLTGNPVNPVTVVVNTKTLGNWRSAYGGDGYDLVADASGANPKLPAYATVSVSGASTFTWGANTGNPDALRNAGATGDIAATWYSTTSFDIRLGLTDGQAHLVTLYALDWDNVLSLPFADRSERIDVLDAGTGSVLATQTIGSFTGEYLSFTIQGSVILRVTNLTPAGHTSNAVISGLFFGGSASSTPTPTPTPTPTASFVGPVDTKTLGNWRSAYGGDGYDLVADASGANPKLPAYATVSVSGASTFIWGANTGNPDALRNAGATGDIAATWYSTTSFDIRLGLTDGQAHLVTLYALDWDNVLSLPFADRSERIDVLDAGTGSLLATQTIGSFTGEYLSFTIQGSVILRVTNLTPAGHTSNAVISGLFFGGSASSTPTPTPTPTPTASFVGPVDTKTLGNWRSAYGGDGYDLVADASGANPKLPAYATVSVSGASTFTWGANTGNPDALRNAGVTGDIAATWYSTTSFDIRVGLDDGQAHLVTLYALDWDNVLGLPFAKRSERIDVLDAGTGSVLATQTIGSFTGEYLSFTIQGSVILRVTNLTPAGHTSNAVISGLFLGTA